MKSHEERKNEHQSTKDLVAKNLRVLRLAHNYTTTEVAKAIGVASWAYRTYESATSLPSFITLNKICEFYRLNSPTSLIGEITVK